MSDKTDNDVLEKAINKWENFLKEKAKNFQEAENTKSFWEVSNKIVELKSSDRRLIRESKTHQISLLNSSRFSSHWFALFNDIFVHINGSSFTAYPLSLLWVELLPDSDSIMVNFIILNL